MKFFNQFLGLIVVLTGGFFVFSQSVAAEEGSPQLVRVEMFERLDCAHCKAEKQYLETLVSPEKNIEVHLESIF